MKKQVLSIISIVFILTIISGQEITLRPYGIKSGIIEYSYSGDKIGKGTLYFDDYGTRSAMFTDAIEQGEKRKGWVVTSGEFQYIWDPDDPTEGIKLKNPIISWAATKSRGDIDSFTKSIYSGIGFTKAANEIFMGKECKVMKGNMGKVLTWNGILMLLDMKEMGISSHQEVTKIQTNIPVDGKYFNIPKDVDFSEMPGF